MPMNDAHPNYFGLRFGKKKHKTGEVVKRIEKEGDSIISSKMSLDAWSAIHKMISFSDGFFWQSVAVKS